MPDKAQSQLLTRLIAVGYLPKFLTDPRGTSAAALEELGFALVSIIYGTDFNGLFGQTTVPYGFIATDPNGASYVAIRGTDDAEEWAEDAWAFPEPWPFGGEEIRTHKGFTDLFETLADERGRSLIGACAGLNAIVTGHSLGAALATLLAAALGSSCSYCETFEGPRVGNSAFCTWMDGRVPSYFRDVIVGDLVPHAPPEVLGYFHAGAEVDLDPGSLIPRDPKSLHILSSVQTLLAAGL